MGLEAIIALIIGIVAGIIGIIRFILDYFDLWPKKKTAEIKRQPPKQERIEEEPPLQHL